MIKKLSRKLLVTGATGLVGSRFVQLFEKKFTISTIGRENVHHKINLLSKKEVIKHITSSDVDAVVNFAAYTNVDGAENEKGDENGEVYVLNALLPLWLSEACRDSGKGLYHISTDYVFDGSEKDNPYTEEDVPKPLSSWYSLTKYEGELNVKRGFGKNSQGTIVRISFPYSAFYQRKLDFARVIVDKLNKGENYFGIIDQKIKPTWVDDIAEALGFLIVKNASGIYHVAGKYQGKGYTSPYDFAKKFAKIMNLDLSLIKQISFRELSQKRIASRPQNTWLDTKKIESLGFEFPDIDQVLIRFKEQFNS